MVASVDNFMQFIEGPFDRIEGMCFKDSAALTIYLLENFYSEDNRLDGVGAEIGVWKGKYLSSIYRGTAKFGAPVHAVDFFAWDAKQHHVEENFKDAFGEHDRLVFTTADSTELNAAKMAVALNGKTISFASIDGAHKRMPVMNDLDTIYGNLAANGIISVDDFQYQPAIEVADGLYEWWFTREHDLAPFAFCTNKLFLCRSAFYEKAYAVATAWAREDGPDSLISVQLSRSSPGWRTDMALLGRPIVHLHETAT